ncbi:DUF1501 domain-containing protein [Roseateles sp. BYS180W]|uniref:DUF1501 domain-containing protein n=1 Tax=Roseateles rivi TaxID=3299028 RepID=A0ABW7FQP2_9BURK
MSPIRLTRRSLLGRGAALASLGGGSAFALNLAALGSASAAASDYKALVCIFMYGGNDAFNTVLPTDEASWRAYQAVRRQAPDSIALLAPGTLAQANAKVGTPERLGGVLPITPRNAQGRQFALHPLMGSTRDMFNAGRLAIVSNVGPLMRPTTKAEYASASHPKPSGLFSHNDQQFHWQAMRGEGASNGWGGRMADLLASANHHALFTAISTSGNAVFLSGRQTLQYQMGLNGAVRIGVGNGHHLFGSVSAQESLRRIMRNTRTDDVLGRDHAAVVGRSIDAEALINGALPSATSSPFGTPGLSQWAPEPLLMYDDPLSGSKAINPLAQQLQVVARMIAARSALGLKRQVFFVSMSGFDTHDQQNRQHAKLMARLAHGMQYFGDVVQAMGMADQVTTFTASDFGRTFTSNGDGTDHGWGGHHFVMGGAVRGGDIYGEFPQLGVKNSNNNDFDSSPHQLRNGALLPSTSVDQFGATLGSWMGVSETTMLDVFPNLGQFDSNRRTLGFMA